ncbi:MAG TPA: hypothetical protein VI749_08005 [Candidatus Omnitrophota bacterium]|nr:hypothetical protein [Candidatus Omnitrophota bacterium]
MNFPIFKSRYFWFVVAGAFIYKTIALVIYIFYPEHLSWVWSEGNIGENMAAAAWGIGSVLCLIKFLFFFGKKDKWVLWLWCFMAFFLGFMRELDMHKALENINGMTWKVDWLGDASVSIFLKIIIVVSMIGMVGGMFGSVIWHRRQIIKALKEGNVLVTVFAMGMVYMAFGFLIDGSVLGKKLFFPVITMSFSKLCEEVFETLGATMAACAVVPFFCKKNVLSDNQ